MPAAAVSVVVVKYPPITNGTSERRATGVFSFLAPFW
jgi:hypothetical protein